MVHHLTPVFVDESKRLLEVIHHWFQSILFLGLYMELGLSQIQYFLQDNLPQQPNRFELLLGEHHRSISVF